jgi:hypothetical protein
MYVHVNKCTHVGSFVLACRKIFFQRERVLVGTMSVPLMTFPPTTFPLTTFPLKTKNNFSPNYVSPNNVPLIFRTACRRR